MSLSRKKFLLSRPLMFGKKIVMREYCPVVLFTESKINSTT